jgi:hypothetical protein
VRQLRELVAALERRVPQPQREGEDAITRDASALMALALSRLDALADAATHPDISHTTS